MSTGQVTIETLKILKEIIEGKSATQIASEYSYAGTSPITRRVTQACEEMGVSFFEKRKRGDLIPTEEAKEKLDVLKQLLACYEKLCMHERKDTIVIPHSVFSLFIPRLQLFYTNVLRKIPYRQINVQIMQTEAEAKLLNNEIDFAFLAEPSEPQRYNMILFMRTSMYIMAPPDHPLAAKKEVNLIDLEKYPLICSHAYAGYLKKLENHEPEIFRKLNIRMVQAPINAVNLESNEIVLGSNFSFDAAINFLHTVKIIGLPERDWYFCTLRERENEKVIWELNEKTADYVQQFFESET